MTQRVLGPHEQHTGLDQSRPDGILTSVSRKTSRTPSSSPKFLRERRPPSPPALPLNTVRSLRCTASLWILKERRISSVYQIAVDGAWTFPPLWLSAGKDMIALPVCGNADPARGLPIILRPDEDALLPMHIYAIACGFQCCAGFIWYYSNHVFGLR